MNYVVISDGTLTKRFKAIRPWRGVLDKAAKANRTLGGIDFTMGKLYETHTFTFKVRHTEDDPDFGNVEDLKTLYKANKVITFTDFYGAQHNAVFVDNGNFEPLSTVIEGGCAYFLYTLHVTFLD